MASGLAVGVIGGFEPGGSAGGRSRNSRALPGGVGAAARPAGSGGGNGWPLCLRKRSIAGDTDDGGGVEDVGAEPGVEADGGVAVGAEPGDDAAGDEGAEFAAADCVAVAAASPADRAAVVVAGAATRGPADEVRTTCGSWAVRVLAPDRGKIAGPVRAEVPGASRGGFVTPADSWIDAFVVGAARGGAGVAEGGCCC